MDEKYAALARKLDWGEGDGAGRHIRVVELADEPGDGSIVDADLEAFRRFLKKRGITPAHVSVATWGDVLPYGFETDTEKETPEPPEPLGAGTPAPGKEDDVPEPGFRMNEPAQKDVAKEKNGGQKTAPKSTRKNLPQRRLIYYTRLFRAQKTSDLFKTATRAVEKHLPGARTTVNFRSGVRRVLTPETADWFRMGREGAVTMMWNEDWLNTYGWRRNGVELVSYYVELMRSAARPRNLAVGAF
ncbi:MAG: hypothetical protein ACLFWL_04470 [Candidatus Brocadiia bacterium]